MLIGLPTVALRRVATALRLSPWLISAQFVNPFEFGSVACVILSPLFATRCAARVVCVFGSNVSSTVGSFGFFGDPPKRSGGCQVDV